MSVENILITEGIILDEECVVCYKNFINVKDSNYIQFLEKIKEKYKLSETENRYFEDETTCLCYDDDYQFKCLTCKNKVCSSCIMNMPDVENGKVEDGYDMFCNDYARDENGEIVKIYRTLSMDETGIITCPVCRTIYDKNCK